MDIESTPTPVTGAALRAILVYAYEAGRFDTGLKTDQPEGAKNPGEALLNSNPLVMLRAGVAAAQTVFDEAPRDEQPGSVFQRAQAAALEAIQEVLAED